MFKIGVFVRISQVSIRTLRFYDEVGLIKPAFVDEETGYRYYALDQLPRLLRVLALKDLGFSLEEIARMLRGRELPADRRGSFDGLGGAFGALAKWTEANGYRIVGAAREIYLQFDHRADPSTYVTEVQFPVVKE